VVLRRKVKGRAHLTTIAGFLVQMYRWFPEAVTIIRPETLVHWHRAASPLLELAGRAPANRNRIAGTDQTDQHGEPTKPQRAQMRGIVQLGHAEVCEAIANVLPLNEDSSIVRADIGSARFPARNCGRVALRSY
jgi:hypothetical protein